MHCCRHILATQACPSLLCKPCFDKYAADCFLCGLFPLRIMFAMYTVQAEAEAHDAVLPSHIQALQDLQLSGSRAAAGQSHAHGFNNGLRFTHGASASPSLTPSPSTLPANNVVLAPSRPGTMLQLKSASQPSTPQPSSPPPSTPPLLTPFNKKSVSHSRSRRLSSREPISEVEGALERSSSTSGCHFYHII